MSDLYGFNANDASRIAKAVTWFEGQGQQLAPTNIATPVGDNQCIVAQITSGSGMTWAWTQAQFSGTSWSVRTDARALSGTTSKRPAVFLGTGTAPNFTNQYVILVRAKDNQSPANNIWIIAGSAGGVTGTLNVVTSVSWDGTSLKYASQTITITNGLVTNLGTSSNTTVVTPTVCT